MAQRGTINQHLSRAFAQHADRVAIEEWPGGRTLTYAQLDASSASLAAHLSQRGVGPGSLVPLVMPRSADYLIAIVAILRCGAAYAPIDPAAPRREAMLQPLGSPVVLGSEPGMLDPAGIARSGGTPRVDTNDDIDPDTPAYVMYTSGTTGAPKGVLVPHRAVVRLVIDANFASFGPDHRWGVMSATAFDASTLEIWGALLHGGCCVVQTLPTPGINELADYLTAGRVDDTWLTASLFNAMVDEKPRAMAGMRQLLTGGERESVPHIRRFKKRCPAVTLIHGYGPTENTTFSLCHAISEADARGDRIPIGTPIDGSTMRIVEPGAGPDAPPAPLAEGELLVGGEGLALGYLGDQAKTVKKFVTDRDGERWYRTGDTVRLREDGAAVFTGRVDRQVKIRGHRIEPDGIESELAACAGVNQAAITVTGDTPESRHMVAFFVPQNGADPALVRDQLAQRLPPTMIPDRFVPIASMPTGFTGKVDRATLITEPESISTQLRRTMHKYRDRTAIEEWPSGRSISYGELDQASGGLARELISRGVKPGSFVPIVMPRCADYVIAVIAVLRCGAAYVPVDPTAPRRWQMLELLGSTTTIGRESGMLNPASVQSVSDGPDVSVDPSSPAYVMYTSGTTGIPKGVVVPHQGVTRLVHLADYAIFDASQRWGVMSATAFDLSTLELWGGLLHGGCCVVQTIPLPNTTDLAQYLVEARISDTWLTASLFNAMVDEYPEAMADMGQLLTGGERESAAHIRSFKQHCPDVTLIHGYGPTENTTFSLCHTITDNDARSDRIPIGRPINRSTMRIVEPGAPPDAPVQPLREGELLVGGLGLAHGYLGDPTRTAEKFVTDAHGERWYRTGDLVHLREDDAAVFMGRLDRQVKIRGHRIEPDGVEHELAACEGVNQAAITVTGDTPESRHMVAFFVPQNGADPALVRDQLAQRLPPTMIPDRFVPIASMPMGATGKIDRTALLAHLTHEPAAPSRAMTATEAKLAELFAKRLGHAIGPEIRFQDAGGHSLLAMRLSADVRRELGVALPAAEILRQQTIASIAGMVDGLPSAPDTQPPEAPSPIGDIRRRASLEHARDTTGRAMLVHHAWHLSPAIPLEQLREAWITLLERHDALRTSVRFADAGPELVEHDPRTSAVFHAEHDRPGAPDDGDPVVRAAAERTIAPDDPPARLHAWTMADGSQLLLMVFHHASVDEWSLDLIADELDKLLLAEPLPDPLPYAAFVNAEYAMMDSELAERLADRIAGGSGAHAELPPGGAQAGRSVDVSDPMLSTDVLQERALAFNVGLASLVATAYSMSLQELFGPPARWIMTPVARRGSEPLQRVVGCCLDICVLEAPSDSDLGLVARSLHQQFLDAQSDRTLPLEVLTLRVRTKSPERAADATRFGLTYRHIDDAPRGLGGSVATPIDIEQSAARFGLCLHVEQRTTGLRLWLEASASYFTHEDLRRIGASIIDRLLGRASEAHLQPARLTQPTDFQHSVTSSRENQELAELWRDLVGSPPHAHSDFFLSGGNSLLAMRLAAAVHRRLGRRLMLNQFLRKPTFEGLALCIRDDFEHPYAEFSLAQEPITDAPWCVAIPGSAGRAIDYYRLWSQLGPNACDMLAFDLTTIATGEESTFETSRFLARFAALSHAYALRHDRSGPMTVIGYSLGGLVALDTAHRLAQLGHPVERIVLIDAFAPAYMTKSPASLLASLHARLRYPRSITRARKNAQPTHANHDAQTAQANRATWRRIHARLARWSPPAAPCPVTLVRSAPMLKRSRPLWNARTNGLGRLVGPDPDIRLVDIEHLSMLTSHASHLADELRDLLAHPPATPEAHHGQSPPSVHRPR